MVGRSSDARALALLEAAEPDTAPVPVPSFHVLYTQYFEFVWGSARRLGTDEHALDDVVQEIFIVIHSKLHTLEKPAALRSWIYGIVRRTVSNYHRSRRARGDSSPIGVDSELESSQPTPLEATQRNSDLELLALLLAELDEPKREIFALVELDEMTVPEVAEALEIPLNTAYSRLRAARVAFEAALARHEAHHQGKGR